MVDTVSADPQRRSAIHAGRSALSVAFSLAPSGRVVTATQDLVVRALAGVVHAERICPDRHSAVLAARATSGGTLGGTCVHGRTTISAKWAHDLVRRVRALADVVLAGESSRGGVATSAATAVGVVFDNAGTSAQVGGGRRAGADTTLAGLVSYRAGHT